MSEPRPRDGFYDFQADNSGRTKTKLDSGPLKTRIVFTNIEEHVCVFLCLCEGLRVLGLQRPKHMLISVSFLKVGMDIWIRLINLTILKKKKKKLLYKKNALCCLYIRYTKLEPSPIIHLAKRTLFGQKNYSL